MGIGAFARAAGVTVKTLRHYAAIGVLPPAQVDGRTGYRRYRAAQLPLLQRIRLLAGWGCTLAEIRAQSGRQFDPDLVEVFADVASQLCAELYPERTERARHADDATPVGGGMASEAETTVRVSS